MPPGTSYLMGWRDVARSTDERTIISSILPLVSVGNNCPLMMLSENQDFKQYLCANLSSFAYDFVARQKLAGTHANYFVFNQLPVLPPDKYINQCSLLGIDEDIENRRWHSFLLPRVLELTYTTWDLQSFAQDCGYNAPPFKWNEERRFQIRCELDAAYFHLYLGTEEEWKEEGTSALLEHFPTPRHAVDYIMDTFPITKRKEEQKHGEYRTKRQTLEIYDKITDSIRTSNPYQTILDPPPADPSVAHRVGNQEYKNEGT
jgi:hypothetical protein